MTAPPDPARRPPRNGERGQVTIFGLGLVLAVLMIGGVSVDLWRVWSDRRALAEMADSAAAAAANGLDVDRYRTAGELALDPDRAEALARQSLGSQRDREMLTSVDRLGMSGEVFVVQLSGETGFTLLRLLGGDRFEMTVIAEATPRAPD